MAKYWGSAEYVDGAKLTVEQHAKALAEKLNLSDEQRAILCSELGNALVPAFSNAEGLRAILAAKQIERLLAQRCLAL